MIFLFNTICTKRCILVVFQIFIFGFQHKQYASDYKDVTFVGVTFQMFSSADDSLKDEPRLLLLLDVSLVILYTFVLCVHLYIYLYIPKHIYIHIDIYTYIHMCVHIQKYKHRYIDIDIYKYKRNFPNVISDDFSKTPEFCPKSATTGPLWIRVV